MSWCPKCKQEFQDGITVCPTCDETLVEKLDTTVVMKEIDFFSEEEVTKFISFLTYSNIHDTSWEKDETLGLYRIRCKEENIQEVVKLFGAFKSVEEEAKDEIESEEAAEETVDNLDSTSLAPYVKKQDQYSDVQSTGVMLVGIGVVGLLYVLLNSSGVLHLLHGVIPYSLNIALFAAAFTYGLYSLNQAKQLKGQIAEEKAVEDEINKWLDETVTDEFLEKNSDTSLPKEANYLKQCQVIRQLAKNAFPDVKENFLDSLIEEKMNEL